MPLLLIIDACLSKRLAVELIKRGRFAKSAHTLGIADLKDDPLLDALAATTDPWVLVTSDDSLPAEHRVKVAQYGATIATIEGEWEKLCDRMGVTMTLEQFRRDTVHRWAHVMAAQADGEIRRYSPFGHAKWTWRPKYGPDPAKPRAAKAADGARARDSGSGPAGRHNGATQGVESVRRTARRRRVDEPLPFDDPPVVGEGGAGARLDDERPDTN